MILLALLCLVVAVSLYSVTANLIILGLGIKVYTEFIKEKKYRQ